MNGSVGGKCLVKSDEGLSKMSVYNEGNRPMSEKYQYFILKVALVGSAKGEYLGPYESEEARDLAACEMRDSKGRGRRRGVFCYRVNINKGRVEEIVGSTKVAA